MQILVETVKKIYHKTPKSARFIYWPLRFIDRLAYRSFNKLRYELWILSGKETESKEGLKIIYAGINGRVQNKNYLVKLAFDQSLSEQYLGKTWLWNVSRIIKEKACDCSLLCMEVHDVFQFIFNKIKPYFYVPCWIEGEIDISFESHSQIKESLNKNKTLKDDLRKIRKYKMDYEISHEISDLHTFYHTMHLPYVSGSHDNVTVINDYDFIKKEFRNSDLLLVKCGSEYIAGVMIKYSKKGPRLRIAGVKDAKENYIHDGAVGALYYYSVNYLKEKGFKKLDVGLTRAFLKDGVLRYKKKWGLSAVDADKSGFIIKPLKNSEGMKMFFIQNPFVFQNGDKHFNGAVFIKNEGSFTENDFKKLYKDYYFQGMTSLNIYFDGEVNHELREAVPTELRDTLKIYPAESFFENEGELVV